MPEGSALPTGKSLNMSETKSLDIALKKNIGKIKVNKTIAFLLLHLPFFFFFFFFSVCTLPTSIFFVIALRPSSQR